MKSEIRNLEPKTKASFLANGGPLARLIPGYQERASQLKMERACLDLDEGNLIVEAPTGTGKSFAYLSAAIREQRSVIVTGNIALQEQLIEKDLPLLHDSMGGTFSFALKKGVSNYICHREVEDAGPSLSKAFQSHYTASLADFSLQDLSNVPDSLQEEAKGLTTRTCTKCEHMNACHYIKEKEAADSANVVVTNYHMYFLDELTGKKLLGDRDLVIFDEAHKAESIARDISARRLTKHTFDRLRIGTSLFGYMSTVLGDKENILAQDLSDFQRRRFEQIIKETKHLVRERFSLLELQIEGKKLAGKNADDDYAEQQKLSNLMAAMTDLLESPEERATYFDENGFHSLKLDIKVDKQKKHIFTSATIGDFKAFKKSLGIDEANELKVSSPFDYERNMLAIIPDQMSPNPNSNQFREDAIDVIHQALDEIEGGILVLTTSTYNCRYFAENVKTKRTKLVQGEAPRTKLVERMKEDGRAILFGTESFWAGVDVKGSALQCVIIDKIPMSRPNDPLMNSLQRLGRNTFGEKTLPHAKIQLAQGIGRLIRTTEDFGVVILLDRRLKLKNYGKGIAKHVIPSRSFQASSLDKIKPFFDWRKK